MYIYHKFFIHIDFILVSNVIVLCKFYFFFAFSNMNMGITVVSWVFKFFFILLVRFQLGSSSSSSSSSSLHPFIVNSKAIHQNYTAISEFRVLNRKSLKDCSNMSPYLNVNMSSKSSLGNEEYITVTVSGVLLPSEHDWVAMISPSHSE